MRIQSKGNSTTKSKKRKNQPYDFKQNTKSKVNSMKLEIEVGLHGTEITLEHEEVLSLEEEEKVSIGPC